MQEKVVVITGVSQNGVGYGVAKRLLELVPPEHQDKLTLVFACRNYTRAMKARHRLVQAYPHATVDLLLVDLSSTRSVLAYQWIDYLFLNAGHLDYVGVNWHGLGRLLWNEPIRWMEHSGSTLQDTTGELTQDRIGKVFASNVFGHYTMIRELESLLAAEEGRIIWTSSSTAQSECFNIEDWQGLKCETPYESSKWACDLLSVAANDYFMQRQLRITSFTISPGVVSSRIGNFPLWILYLRTFLHYLYRFLFGVESQNITGYRGSVAAVFVALQPLFLLNSYLKYTSATNRWGTTFVKPVLLNHLKMNQAYALWDHCEYHYQNLKHIDDSSLICSTNNRPGC